MAPWVGDDLEDPHAAATFSAAGDALREDAGEEVGPASARKIWERRTKSETFQNDPRGSNPLR